MIFETINTVVSHPSPPVPVFSKEDRDGFPAFFCEQGDECEKSIIAPSSSPHVNCPVPPPQLCSLLSYHSYGLPVRSMKMSSSPLKICLIFKIKTIQNKTLRMTNLITFGVRCICQYLVSECERNELLRSQHGRRKTDLGSGEVEGVQRE